MTYTAIKQLNVVHESFPSRVRSLWSPEKSLWAPKISSLWNAKDTLLCFMQLSGSPKISADNVLQQPLQRHHLC